MAAFVKFHAFVEAVAEKKHNLGSDTLKVYLTNDVIDPAGDAVKADLAEIAAGNGYTAGGGVAAQASSAQVGGLYTLILNDPPTWTASGVIGPFRSAVLYNDSAANKDLIGAWTDPAGPITLQAGDTYKVNLADAGVLTLQ
jgi:hypothetical protein